MAEKKRDFNTALEAYLTCLAECDQAIEKEKNDSYGNNGNNNHVVELDDYMKIKRPFQFVKELRGEIMLRIAVLRKETGALDLAMHMCSTIASEQFGDSIRANALCLKVNTEMKKY